jgi:quercetin dioxygenase-like cupin family protein
VAGWRSVKLDDIEPIPIDGGQVLWRPVRRTLDVGAFGINAFIARDAGDDVVEEHTEEFLGHEEVYVVLAGRATFALDDETLDAPSGSVVFVHDPTVKRRAHAEEPQTAVLAVGGPRGAVYEPPAWEAERHRAPEISTRTRQSLLRRSSAAPTIRACSTSSRALKPSRAGRTPRSHTCGARSSSDPS